jgi:hypothetical protein
MKEILYPKFLRLSQYVEDMYWKHIFEDIAYGVCPSGTYVDKNTLYSTYSKESRFAFDLTSKECCVETANEIIHLLHTKLHLMSSIENLKRRENLNVALKCSYTSWKDIKKKNIRDILLENYVISIMHENNLSIQEGQKLLKQLNLRLHFKLIQPHHIIYNPETSRIQTIHCFDYMSILKEE